MATVAETFGTSGIEAVPFPITSDVFERMVEQGLIPRDRRVFLWGGRFFEKMAKSRAHVAVQNAFDRALNRRLPPGFFVAPENPVRLDEAHVPLPDLVVVRGEPLDFFDTRDPDGRDVRLVVEVAVSRLPEDLGSRLSRYAQGLPLATYVVADIPHRQALVHTLPQAADDQGPARYAERTVVRPGEAIHLRVDGVDLEAIPYDEVMR